MTNDRFGQCINNAIAEMRKRKLIDATKLSLSEWLNLVKSHDREELLFVDWQFPTKSMRDEYLDTIQTRTEDEVIDLLRNFLMFSGSYGCDDYLWANIMDKLEQNEITLEDATQTEHLKNLMKSIISPEERAWEGNTWIIDLLPDNPRLAIDALQAYLVSHFQYLPDGKIDGMLDAMALIQAKFIDTPRDFHLFSLDPHQFELLVSTLYRRMGYTTALTKMTHDGGRDVIAEKEQSGEKERLLIQCKRTGKNVDVKEVRALLGVVSDEKATKGVFVCASGFTPAAKQLEVRNRRLELIDNEDLQILLNEYLGTRWSKYISEIVSKRLAETKSRTSLT
jgi:restriction system protein